MWQPGWEEIWGRMDTCVGMAESLCCPPETITTLLIGCVCAQSCLTLCDPMDYTVHGILQARILEWIAFPFSRGSSRTSNQTQISLICRWILYQLSCQGSPLLPMSCINFPCVFGLRLSILLVLFHWPFWLVHHGKSKRVPEKHLFLLYWLCQSLWLCGSQSTVENSERDGNTKPPDLPLEKPICRSGSNS